MTLIHGVSDAKLDLRKLVQGIEGSRVLVCSKWKEILKLIYTLCKLTNEIGTCILKQKDTSFDLFN